MKRIVYIILPFVVISVVLFLLLFNPQTPECQHKWKQEYLSDAQYHWQECSECGALTDKIYHTCSEWIINTDSTCVGVGSKCQKCTQCDSVVSTEVIEKKQHDMTEWAEKSPADCENAQILERHCKNCLTNQQTMQGAGALDHAESDWLTCYDNNKNETGYEEKICLNCKKQLNYKNKEYTAIFDSNGGSVVDSIKGVFDGLISKPANPQKQGFTFAGWYIDNNTFENEFFTLSNGTVAKMPIGGITVYAKWEQVEDNTFTENQVIYRDLGNGEYELVGGLLPNINSEKYKIVSVADNAFMEWQKGTQYEIFPPFFTITIPATVKTIGVNAFNNALLLDVSFEVCSKLEYIGDNAFAGNWLANNILRLPEGLKSIGNNAFEAGNSNYSEIKVVYLPSTLQSVGQDVFKNQQNLNKIICASEKLTNNEYINGLLGQCEIQNCENGVFVWVEDILFWKSNADNFARLVYYNPSGKYTTYIDKDIEGYYEIVTLPKFDYNYIIESYAFYNLTKVHRIEFADDANIIKIEFSAFGDFKQGDGLPHSIGDMISKNWSDYPNFIFSSKIKWQNIELEQDWLYLDNGTNQFNIFCSVSVKGDNSGEVEIFLRILSDSLSIKKENGQFGVKVDSMAYLTSPNPNKDDYKFAQLIVGSID